MLKSTFKIHSILFKFVEILQIIGNQIIIAFSSFDIFSILDNEGIFSY